MLIYRSIGVIQVLGFMPGRMDYCRSIGIGFSSPQRGWFAFPRGAWERDEQQTAQYGYRLLTPY